MTPRKNAANAITICTKRRVSVSARCCNGLRRGRHAASTQHRRRDPQHGNADHAGLRHRDVFHRQRVWLAVDPAAKTCIGNQQSIQRAVRNGAQQRIVRRNIQMLDAVIWAYRSQDQSPVCTVVSRILKLKIQITECRRRQRVVDVTVPVERRSQTGDVTIRRHRELCEGVGAISDRCE